MLSRRAQKNMSWFLNKYQRQLKNQQADGPPAIDLATAENWLIRDEVLSILKAAAATDLSPLRLSYASGLGGPKDLLAATSEFFNHFFAPRRTVVPAHLVAGAGCSSILETLLHDICDDGDGILIEGPMWGSFEISCVMRNGVKLIPVAVPALTRDPLAIVQHYRRALQAADCTVRGVLFCNPHNPRGQIYPSDIIEALLCFCEENNLHFVSDEIYALSTFGSGWAPCESSRIHKAQTTSFTSVLQMRLDTLGVNASRVHTLYSISKDLGSSGLRLGFLVTQANPELRMSLAILNNAKVSTVTALMATRIFSRISELEDLLGLSVIRLRSAAALVADYLAFHDVTFYMPVAGVYVWARLGGDGSTWAEEAELMANSASAGIMIGAGADYMEAEPGWFRVSFALPPPSLLEGLRRIENWRRWEKSWRPGFGETQRGRNPISIWQRAANTIQWACRPVSGRRRGLLGERHKHAQKHTGHFSEE